MLGNTLHAEDQRDQVPGWQRKQVGDFNLARVVRLYRYMQHVLSRIQYCYSIPGDIIEPNT